jgi:outer membrane protein assembly factor BamA
VRAALLLLACAGPALGQVPGSGLELESLDFEGNAAFPEDSLRLAIINRATSCPIVFLRPFCRVGLGENREVLLPRELPSDVARLRIYYYERGYREATVDTTVVRDVERGRAQLTFRIQEGQPILIDSIAFFGGDVLGEGALLTNLPIQRGDPLSAFLLDQARDSLLIRLRNEG